jgi:hypothetical protein
MSNESSSLEVDSDDDINDFLTLTNISQFQLPTPRKE